MLMRDRGKLVIWPVYLDRTRTRSDGRIISKKKSVREPELKEIEKAASRLGLNPEIEEDKAYPRSWWEVSGRVMVDKTAPKSYLLKQISKIIKENREGGK
jgi:signal recognition particle subunit SRP19